MASQDEDSTEIVTTVGDGCDESKCVSTGNSNLHNDSFTCYGDDGTFYPRICADGFLPMIASNEASVMGVDPEERQEISLSYFTCCPPSSKTTEALRQCSDPLPNVDSVDDLESLDRMCSDQEEDRNHARRMKSRMEMDGATVTRKESFLCCGSTLPNATMETTNFLDNVECVPYHNDFYETTKAQNQIGQLFAISCDFSEGDFLFPLPFDSTDVASTGLYQCCKNGPALSPFVPDSAFKITLYPVIALWSIAAIVSWIVALGLILPLLIQLNNGTFRRDSTRSSSRASSRTKGTREPRYSTYNVYLIYLALLDFIYALFQIGLYGSTANQMFHPRFYPFLVSPSTISYGIFSKEAPISFPYVVANMWINTIICYQVLVLLRNSQRAQRIKSPSLKRVNLQAGGVVLGSALFGVVIHFLSTASNTAGTNGNFPTIPILTMTFYALLLLLIVPPLGYLIWVTGLIWWRGYMPAWNGASPTDKARRELAFYFFRIIAVFIGIYLPCSALSNQYHWESVMILALQPVVTSGMILTKSDAKQYILDLVSLSYLLGAKKSTATVGDSTRKTIRNASAASAPTGSTGDCSSKVENVADVEAKGEADVGAVEGHNNAES